MGSSVILPQPGQPVEGPDPNFRSQTVKRAISFATEHLSPPSPLYVTAENKLLIQAATSIANQGLKISLRTLFPDGTINYGETVFQLTGNRTQNTFEIPLQEGFLLSVHAAPSPLGTQRGQMFCHIDIEYGNVGFGAFVQKLLADYLTTPAGTGWPGGQIRQASEGPGLPIDFAVTPPAAGTDWAYVIPASAKQRIQSLSAIFTTSATAGNRNIELIADDGAAVYWRTSAPASVAASTAQVLSATGTNAPTGVITTDFNVVIPPTLIQTSGHRIRTNTVGIQAGDQWTAILVYVEEWLQL